MSKFETIIDDPYLKKSGTLIVEAENEEEVSEIILTWLKNQREIQFIEDI